MTIETQEQKQLNINIALTEGEQAEVLKLCNAFKQSMISHSQLKKKTMQQCYSYFKSVLMDGDVLPRPNYGEGAERDAQTNRPSVFLPLTRTIIKQLHADIKTAIFPTNSDYFRILAADDSDEEAKVFEDELTQVVEGLFKKSRIQEQISAGILNAAWSGFCAGIPYVELVKPWQWEVNGSTGDYQAVSFGSYEGETSEQQQERLRREQNNFRICIENCNPLDFYIDPSCKKPEFARWMYLQQKKLYEFTDNPAGFSNLEKLKDVATTATGTRNAQGQQRLDTSVANGLNQSYQDIEPVVDYDLFYFPYLKLKESGKVFRNVIAGVAASTVLVRFAPNLLPQGLNPAVFATWADDVDSSYGTGIAEDILPLQRLVNLVFNHAIETLARNGNILAVDKSSDLSQMSGVAGGVMYTDGDPNKAVMQLNVDDKELGTLLAALGSIKAEAQTLAGSQHPYTGMGSPGVAKTATEFASISNVVANISKETIQHLVDNYVQPILELVVARIGEAYTSPVRLRIDKGEATNYAEVNLSILNKMAGRFRLELTSVNLPQSRLAMVNTLKELLTLVSSDPRYADMLKNGGYDLLVEIAKLSGIRDYDKLLFTPAEQKQNASNQASGVLMQLAQMAQQVDPQIAEQLGGLAKKFQLLGSGNAQQGI